MDMQPLTRFTSLPRVIDPRLKNHQMILGLSVIAGAIGTSFGLFVQGSGAIDGLLLGFDCAISAFLTWVLARELDPDHPGSGLIGPLIVLPAVLFVGSPSILAGFWVVLLLRILNRSTGLPAQPPDTMGVILVASLLSVSHHPSAALIGGIALLTDSLLPKGHTYHRGVGAAMIAVGGGFWLYQGVGLDILSPTDMLVGLGAASLIYLVAINLQAEPRSVGDFDGERLQATRVKTAQIAALAFAIIFILFNGMNGFQEQLPLWSAMIGIAGYQFVFQIIGQ